MSRSPAPGVPMRITTGVARCAAAALLMWRVLEVRPLVTGTALGLLGGAIAAWMLDRRRLRLALRLAVAGAVAWIAAACTKGEPDVRVDLSRRGEPEASTSFWKTLIAVAPTLAFPPYLKR